MDKTNEMGLKMKGLLFALIFISAAFFNEANGQRYRNQNNLGNEEMVKFVALKNGDIVEFNWIINSTREIKSIILKKGNLNSNSVEWITVKEIAAEDKRYIDYLPDLGKVFYKLILTDDSGKVSEYEPEFQVKKGSTSLL